MKLYKNGTGFRVRVPKQTVKELEWTLETEVEVKRVGKHIVIKKVE